MKVTDIQITNTARATAAIASSKQIEEGSDPEVGIDPFDPGL
jgi:hypothetical protein